MELQEIERRRKDLVRRDGPWTGHNIHLGGDVYTYGEPSPSRNFLLERIVQIVADTTQRPLSELRVLDLACLEGLYGIEFARHGAEVVGIEARQAAVEKGRFVKDVLGLNNIEFHQDDVRSLSPERYGVFDVVLCLGILYHLDTPEVLEFVHKIGSVCRTLAIMHTHVSMSPRTTYQHGSHTYKGCRVYEHRPHSTQEERLKGSWGSLDNIESFWMTRASLFNLLCDAGFTSVSECRMPYLPTQPDDHVTLVAIKGTRQRILSAPELNEAGVERWPEVRRRRVNPGQKWYYGLVRRYGLWIPGKRAMGRLLGVEWHRPNR